MSHPPHPRLLHNRIAAVTGGTTGIGRAIVLDYLRHGARVVVNHLGHRASAANEASGFQGHVGAWEALVAEAEGLGLLYDAEGVEGAGDADADAEGEGEGSQEKEKEEEKGRERMVEYVGDVTNVETGEGIVRTAVERWGRLDIFVSNAGVCRFADFLTLDQSLLTSTISTNLTGAFTCIQAAARQMSRQTPSGGSIIGISSISALVGGGGQTHYTPTKAGLLSLMQSCAVALGKYGIRCNALLPGTIRTQLNDGDMEDEAKRVYMEGRTCLGRLGRPEDMCGPAVFLGSEMSAYVTGAQLLVDGGLFVNLQ